LNDEEIVRRPAKIVRIFTIFVMISAWFAISNHCALGAVATEAETKSSSDQCPFHTKKSAPEKQGSDSPCCKILRAIGATPAKNLARSIVAFVDVNLAFAKLVVFAPPKISVVPSSLDTGPPGVTSFAELNGSMLAHAPPYLV
jgi:hypothetical protein